MWISKVEPVISILKEYFVLLRGFHHRDHCNGLSLIQSMDLGNGSRTIATRFEDI